uniref:peroxidase n=1 Tax=Cajanus cajan TaxID=3821 RepID=A0A151S0Z0_CAJCA|nr:Cationic peroxidase 1 [Cajanus cajan]
MGASLLRLHFHDCFVQAKQSALPNANSIRGLDVIENIKDKLETLCPGVVSCADIVAVAARDGTVALGGPSWSVGLGRRDSTTADLNAANTELPSPFSELTGLITAFANKNFTANEMVALSGAHTTGKAKCLFFRSRIYEGNNIDPLYARALQFNCPRTGGDFNLTSLDSTTPNLFDNAYYLNLVNKRGLLVSDQELFNGGSTDSLVTVYATNPSAFRTDFANAMVKMSNLNPLTGTNGQVRKLCSRVN